MKIEDQDEKSPWRHHPMFMAYKKFYEGKNVMMGRIIAVAIAIIVLIVCIVLFR
jgi:ABC-type sugar transport system permease subunit